MSVTPLLAGPDAAERRAPVGVPAWEQRSVMALALLAVLLRLSWLRSALEIPVLRRPVLDAQVYHDWAVALLRGENGPAVYFMSPFYAWVLAAVYRLAGPDPVTPRLLQCLLAGVTTLLVAAVARRLGGSLAALSAAALWAVLGTSVFFDGLLLGASLATLLAAALAAVVVLAGERPWASGLAGALLGLLALERPNVLVLAPVLVLVLAGRGERSWRRATARAAAVLAGTALLVAPAALHNWRGGDRVLVSANGGLNFYIGNNRSARGVYAPVAGVPDDPRQQVEASKRIAETGLGRELAPSEVSRFWFRRALGEIGADPVGALRLLGCKLLLVVSSTEPQLNFKYSHFRRPGTVLALPLPGFGLVLALAVAGIWFGKGERVVLGLATLAAVYLLSVATFFVAGRFRMVAMPWLVALAGAGLAALVQHLQARRLTAVLAALPLVVAALLVSHVPGFVQSDAPSFNLSGTVSEEDGRLEDAELEYRMALEERPDYVVAALNLARLLESRGRTEQARSVLAPFAGTPEAAPVLGRLELERGNPEQALLLLERALLASPTDAVSWNLIGVARAQIGRDQQARAAFEQALWLSPSFAPARRNLATLGSVQRVKMSAPPQF